MSQYIPGSSTSTTTSLMTTPSVDSALSSPTANLSAAPAQATMSSGGPYFENADPNGGNGDWYKYVQHCKTCHVVGPMHGGGNPDPDDITQKGDGKIAVIEGNSTFYFNPEQSPSWQQQEWLAGEEGGAEPPAPQDYEALTNGGLHPEMEIP